jgi:hypothetical protein
MMKGVIAIMIPPLQRSGAFMPDKVSPTNKKYRSSLIWPASLCKEPMNCITGLGDKVMLHACPRFLGLEIGVSFYEAL